MKYLSCLIAVLFFLGNYSYATITYDNGQHNIIDSFLNDYVWVFDSDNQQPTTIDVQSNGNIFNSVWVYGSSNVILNGGSIGDAGRDIHAYGNSHIEILSGTAGRYLKLNNSSTAIMSGGSINDSVFTYDETSLTIHNGSIGGLDRDLSINGFSKVFFHNGSIGRNVFIRNDGLLEMTGGNVHGSITANNDAKFLMSGGNIGYDLFAEDTSTVEISGGWIDRIMYARHDAEITMIGTNFNYPLGYIADASGTITGILANGDPIDVSFVREGNGAIRLKDPCIALTVIVPNGGERYLTDKPVDIEYITSGDATIDAVDIEYSSDNGSLSSVNYNFPSATIISSLQL